MLTKVSYNKEKGLKVVKHSHHTDPNIIYEYQVHDVEDALNPIRARFPTKTEADEYINVNLKQVAEKKSKRSKSKVS